MVAIMVLATALSRPGRGPRSPDRRSRAGARPSRSSWRDGGAVPQRPQRLSTVTTGTNTLRLSADITLATDVEPTYTGTQPLTINGLGHDLDGNGLNRALDILPADDRGRHDPEPPGRGRRRRRSRRRSS